MGQCMQMSIAGTRQHKYLGYLQEMEMGDRRYLSYHLPIKNQDAYLGWSKNINRLRYNMEVRDVLYLPLTEQFTSGDGLCSASSYIELNFETYLQTMSECLAKHQKNRRYFQQSYLWYLIYVLTKYIKFFQKKQEELFRLCLENVLIHADGSIRVIPETLIPCYQADRNIFDLQEENDLSNQHRTKSDEPHPPVYLVGVMLLNLADLIMPPELQSASANRWIEITGQKRQRALKNCERRYSALMVQTLSEMTESSSEKRLKISALNKRLEAFQNEITIKRQLGVFMNCSVGQSGKTSFAIENRTVNQNNSNLLRLSEVNQNLQEDESSIGEEQIGKSNQFNKNEGYLHIL